MMEFPILSSGFHKIDDLVVYIRKCSYEIIMQVSNQLVASYDMCSEPVVTYLGDVIDGRMTCFQYPVRIVRVSNDLAIEFNHYVLHEAF